MPWRLCSICTSTRSLRDPDLVPVVVTELVAVDDAEAIDPVRDVCVSSPLQIEMPATTTTLRILQLSGQIMCWPCRMSRILQEILQGRIIKRYLRVLLRVLIVQVCQPSWLEQQQLTHRPLLRQLQATQHPLQLHLPHYHHHHHHHPHPHPGTTLRHRPFTFLQHRPLHHSPFHLHHPLHLPFHFQPLPNQSTPTTTCAASAMDGSTLKTASTFSKAGSQLTGFLSWHAQRAGAVVAISPPDSSAVIASDFPMLFWMT